MTVTLRVYRDDLLQQLGTIPDATQIAWSRTLDGVGTGQFTVAADTEGLTEEMLAAHNLIVVEVDGVDQFAWTIGPPRRQRGDSYDTVQVQGPGATELLDHAGTGPEGGRDTLIPHTTRLFGWMSREFDDGLWAEVGEFGHDVAAGPLTTRGFVSTVPEAYEVYLPGTRNLYRRLLPGLASETPARMMLAAIHGTEVIVYLDGEQVMHRRPTDRGLLTADIPHPDYDVQLAVEVRPGPYFPSGRWGWAWTETDPPTDEQGEPGLLGNLRRTYDPNVVTDATPWLSYAGDQPYPGVTAGFVLRTLYNEAQARGVLVAATEDFDAELDSAGNPWPSDVELSVPVGESLLAVAGRLADLGVSVEMSPGLVLRAWHNRGGSSSAVFPPEMVRDLSVGREDVSWTHLLARVRHEWVYRSINGDWTSTVLRPRREGFVSLGDVPSWESGERILDAILADMRDPLVQGGWTVNSSQDCPVPGVDYDLGDTVTGPTAGMVGEWEQAEVRVLSIGAAVDDVGDVDWVVEVDGG